MKVSDFYKELDKLMPFNTVEDRDISGLLSGRMKAEVSGVLLCLDITHEVINEAVKTGANLIISHHPFLFEGEEISDENPIYELNAKDISAICCHSNMDKAEGIGDVLAGLLGFEKLGLLEIVEDGFGYGFFASLKEETTLFKLAEHVKKAIGCETVRTSKENNPVKTVAICGGGGGSMISFATGNADVLITGDIKHSQFIEAQNAGLCLIDAGHYMTEYPMMSILLDRLKERFPEEKITLSLSESCPVVFR